MTDERKDDIGGLLDLERELTCSICTDILYQPLTLLDCLHTFCGGCLKEWFAWQAEAAARKRRTTHPYTCPSCREPVRGTKADWRLTALLEGYLKANPDKGKTAEEKEETGKHYTPGDNILPEVRWDNDTDSEDERLLADVRDLSMADVDPETARRRRERADRVQQRQRRNRAAGRHGPEELGRTQRPSQWVEQQAQREGPGERHVEHQASLRSLLSGSEVDSQNMQQEILQSIYSEGLLDGIDVDNLTPEQEDELTERIAEAYRRRQRQRERSRNRERQDTSNRSPNPTVTATENSRRTQGQVGNSTTSQQATSRSRPPIARPHLFEQTATDSHRGHRRSASASNQTNGQSGAHATVRNDTAPASRSATDLSNNPSTDTGQSERQRASSTNTRSATDPDMSRNGVRHSRHNSATLRPDAGSPRTRSFDSPPTGSGNRQDRLQNEREVSAQTPPSASPRQTARPVQSTPLATPEPAAHQSTAPSKPAPSITCTRCYKANIQHSLHYNCPKCHNGNYNLCLACYRDGHGCDHWFGFGFRAMHRWRALAPPEGWPRNYEQPHVLYPRRWTPASSSSPTEILEQGAFCESCLSLADTPSTPTRPAGRYWYCEVCLEGAWGFCNTCVLQGKHCTHPLLPLIPASSPSTPSTPPPTPSSLHILPVPHLPPSSRALLVPLDPVSCDECNLPIPPTDPRHHCYHCSAGDYDLCIPCHTQLVRPGALSSADGPAGWRRCPRGRHRMAVVQHRPTPYASGAAFARLTVADPVGGWRLKDEGGRGGPPPSTAGGKGGEVGTGGKLLATWSWFPAEGNRDELTFPRNAEIREGETLNEDWSVGVYMRRVGVFPSNHVRRI